MNQKLNDILEKLKTNPIFKMSLGSKELFHSNFLEYLFTINKESFIQMINDFNLEGIKLQDDVDYQLGREVENFDLCIYHTDNSNENGKKIYDLVIENKVKSIPYKKQLEEYVSKVQEKGSNNCKFILLSLSDEFPDKDDDQVKKWKITNYKTLKESIESQYLGNAQISIKDQTYIRDYCDFIEKLDELKTILIPNDQQQFLFVKKDKDLLENIRLHDLYIKLRCSWFAVCLKKRLEEEGIATKIIYKYEEREFGVVNINVAINQGNGQIAAWICDRDKKKDGKTNMFEIVIQGNQYRHGINLECIDTEKQVKPDRLNELYDRLNNHLEDQRPIKFLNFEGDFSIGANPTQPNKTKNHRKNKSQDPVVQKSGPFDCYGEDYIYRYKKIDNIPISQLLEWMVRDVKIILDSKPDLNTLKK